MALDVYKLSMAWAKCQVWGHREGVLIMSPRERNTMLVVCPRCGEREDI